jgi:hypothetical protein
MATKRQAWLYMDGAKLPLDDYEAGYAMLELDLGYPDVRDVTNNRPVQHGIDDQTRYFGGRVVTAKITAWPGGKVALDDIPEIFLRYMRPGVRPELHYTTISDAGRERVIVLRASAFASPLPSPHKREMSLSWVAPDPLIKDAEVRTAISWAGSSAPPGRSYPLNFNRIYPPGSGASTTAYIICNGDVPVPPLMRFYGPATGPRVDTKALVIDNADPPVFVGQIVFKPSFTIEAGQWVDIDCRDHSAMLNGSEPVLDQIVFSGTQWPLLYPSPYTNEVTCSGGTTSGITQVQIIWQDLYLS